MIDTEVIEAARAAYEAELGRPPSVGAGNRAWRSAIAAASLAALEQVKELEEHNQKLARIILRLEERIYEGDEVLERKAERIREQDQLIGKALDALREKDGEIARLVRELDELRREVQKRPRGNIPHGLYWG